MVAATTGHTERVFRHVTGKLFISASAHVRCAVAEDLAVGTMVTWYVCSGDGGKVLVY